MRHHSRPGGQVTVNMSTDMLDALEQIAYRNNQSISDLIRAFARVAIAAQVRCGRLEDKHRYLEVDKRGRRLGSRNRPSIDVG